MARENYIGTNTLNQAYLPNQSLGVNQFNAVRARDILLLGRSALENVPCWVLRAHALEPGVLMMWWTQCTSSGEAWSDSDASNLAKRSALPCSRELAQCRERHVSSRERRRNVCSRLKLSGYGGL